GGGYRSGCMISRLGGSTIFLNHALVHFQHRTVGYVVAGLVIALHVATKRLNADKPLLSPGMHAVLLTAVQIALGIFTVLTSVSLPLAALHQVCALLLFGTTLWWVYVLSGAQRSIA